MPLRTSSPKYNVRPWNSISAALGATIVVLTLVAGLIVWGAVAAMAEREFIDEHAHQACTMSAIIARDLAEHMLGGGGPSVWADVSSEARQFVDMGGPTRVMTLSASGVVKAASDGAVIRSARRYR